MDSNAFKRPLAYLGIHAPSLISLKERERGSVGMKVIPLDIGMFIPLLP
jgi:hypothetical protein